MSATTLAVRERPIIFSGPMIRALLDGRKTQTRRVMRPQPDGALDYTPGPITRFVNTGTEIRTGRSVWGAMSGKRPINAFRLAKDAIKDDIECPHGAAGDRLWVREAWQVWDEYANTPADSIPGEARLRINYPADGNPWPTRTRSPIFMPRWASRILLELTGVRVERVQEIGEADAIAEGARRFDDIPDPHPFNQGARWSMENPTTTEECLGTARHAFGNLWNAINAKRGYGWDVNPWVWAITFRRITP